MFGASINGSFSKMTTTNVVGPFAGIHVMFEQSGAVSLSFLVEAPYHLQNN